MSNYSKLIATPGIVAVTVGRAGALPDDPALTPRLTHFGEEKWQPILQASLVLLYCAGADAEDLRVVVLDHTIHVQREGALVFAVCIPTGHGVGKSVRRMIRRAVKAERSTAGAA